MMPSNPEFRRLADALGRVLERPSRPVSPPPHCVLMAVLEGIRSFSAGTLNDFAGRFPAIVTYEDLRALMHRSGGPRRFLHDALGLRSTASGDLADRTLAFLVAAQRRFPGEQEADRLRGWATWARPGDFYAGWIDGRSLGQFQRLRGLLGANTARADRRLPRFLSRTLGRHVSIVEGLYLLEAVGTQCDLDVRNLHDRLFGQAEEKCSDRTGGTARRHRATTPRAFMR